MKKIKSLKTKFIITASTLGVFALTSAAIVACTNNGNQTNSTISVANISHSNIKTNEATITVELNNPNPLSTLVLEYEDGSGDKKTATAAARSKSYVFRLNNLTPNTTYKISKLEYKANDVAQVLSLSNLSNDLLGFKTEDQQTSQPEDPSKPEDPVLTPIQPQPGDSQPNPGNTTPTPQPTPPNETKEPSDDFVISSISHLNSTHNTLNLSINFSNNQLLDANNKTFEVTLNSNIKKTFNHYNVNDNKLDIAFDNLAAQTNYEVTSVKLNNKELDLSKLSNKTFQTQQQPTTSISDNFAISSISTANVKGDSLDFHINFSSNRLANSNNKFFEITLSDGTILRTSTYTENSPSLVLTARNLRPNTQYKVQSVKLNNKELSLPQSNQTATTTNESSAIVSAISFTNKNHNSVTINIQFDEQTLSGSGVLVLSSNSTPKNINYSISNRRATINLNDLQPSATYNISSLTLNNLNINLNNTVNKSFTTDAQPQTPPPTNQVQNDDFVISNISTEQLNSDSAILKVEFSKFVLKDNTRKTFEVTFNPQKSESSTNYVAGSNHIFIPLTNLTPNTTYTLATIKLNSQTLNYTSTFSFTTSSQISNLGASSVVVNNITQTSAQPTINFNKMIEGTKNLKLNYKNQRTNEQTSVSKSITQQPQVVFDLNGLTPNTPYELINIDIDGQIINLSNFSNRIFSTKGDSQNQPVLNSSIDFTKMDSFATYEEQAKKLYTNNNLELSAITKTTNTSQNKTYLVFEVSKIPQKKFKDFTFNYNNKDYSVKYDGNSAKFYALVDANSNGTISNIKYDNQDISFSGIITNNSNSPQTNLSNASLNSVSVSGENLVVTISNGSLNTNDKYLVTLKPDVNTYLADVNLEATATSSTQLTINNYKSKVNQSYSKYYATSAFNINGGFEIDGNESAAVFFQWPTLSANISKIQFAKKNDATNTFEGSINLNVSNDLVDQLKDKYIKLSFLNKKQKEIAVPDSDYEKQLWGPIGQGFDYIDRNLRPENNRYVFLNYDELKSFKFNHLTEGIDWVLNKVDIVNKHNLQTVLNLDITNVTQTGLTVLNPTLETQTLSLNSGFSTNFYDSNNQQNTGSNNKTKESLDSEAKSDSPNLNLDWNYNNYRELNKHYLSYTQKLFDLYNDYSTFGRTNYEQYKDETVKKFVFNNNKNYNWGVVVENFDQKFYEHSSKDTYVIKKSLNNFNNLDQSKDAIINFNFFANPENTNLDFWFKNQNAYAVSFSLDYLKAQANQTIDNLEIDFVQNWSDIYYGHNNATDKNDIQKFSLETDGQTLKKLMNQRIKVKVSIINNELVFELKARNGVINDQIYLHNLSQEISTYIERAYNYLSIMYVEDANANNKLQYNNLNVDAKKLRVDGFLFEANNNFAPINKYPLLANEKFNVEVSTWRVTNNDLFNNETLKNVTARSIGINYGTGWMISKVKPNDPNDYKYYFGTNRHVPTIAWLSLSAPKDHNTKEDTSLYFSEFQEWPVNAKPIWEAKDNKRIDGSEVEAHPLPIHASNKKLRSGADLQIVEIDIKPVVDYYNNNKDRNPTDNKFKSAQHIYNWLQLKDIKVSNKGKYIKKDQFFTAYTSSFPHSTTSRSKGNIQMRHNYLSAFAWDNFGDYNYGRTDQIYFRGSFKDIDIEANYQFQPGSSGTGLYDDEGNFLSIHAGKVAYGGNGSYLLNSQRMNFMGDLNDYNDGSFAYMIQRRHRLWPKKYEMLNIFNEFIKPFEK